MFMKMTSSLHASKELSSTDDGLMEVKSLLHAFCKLDATVQSNLFITIHEI